MKKTKIKEDIISFSVVFVLALIAIFYIIPTYVTVPKAAHGVFTPRTYPYMCFAVIAVCAAVGLIKGIFAYYKGKQESDFALGEKKWSEMSGHERIGVLMPWICAGLCILYAVLFGTIGFILSTILIAPVILFILNDKKPMHYVYVYAFCAVMYVLFRFVLNVRLP